MISETFENTHYNIDLGRPLTNRDILANDVYPIEMSDIGSYCYCCQKENGYRLSGLKPLNQGSGVFTNSILCDQDSPVWVCLRHIPHLSDQFEAFIPEVASELKRLNRNER